LKKWEAWEARGFLGMIRMNAYDEEKRMNDEHAALDRSPRTPGGSRPASERDPDLLCTAMKRNSDERCGNYPLVGHSVCRFHVALTPAVKDVAIVARSMRELGLEPVKPAEFPDVIGRLLAEYTDDRAALRDELDTLRLTTASEVDLLREYGDALDRLDRLGMLVAKFMETFAKLSIAGTYEKDVDLTRTAQWTCLVTAMSSVLDEYPDVAIRVAEVMAAADC
jgi:hypothetical protein